jgi:hypothetical protein
MEIRNRISAIISFIGAIGLLLFAIFAYIKDQDYDEKLWICISIPITSIATILYVYWTNFSKCREIARLEHENKVLRLKIEQKELKVKLV